MVLDFSHYDDEDDTFSSCSANYDLSKAFEAEKKLNKLKEWLDKREKENESNKKSADNVGGLTSYGWGRYEELKDILKEVREVLK